MAVEQRLNSYASRDIRYLSVPIGARDLELTEYLKKVGTNGVAKKYRLRILRQQCGDLSGDELVKAPRRI